MNVTPAYEQKSNPKIRKGKKRSQDETLLNLVFGNTKEKWVLCIKFPPSERFTSSLLTPITLGAQLPSRSQWASNHSQTVLSQSHRWKTEGVGCWTSSRNQYDAETKRASYSRDGRWFIDISSSTYMQGTCGTPDNKHKLLFCRSFSL